MPCGGFAPRRQQLHRIPAVLGWAAGCQVGTTISSGIKAQFVGELGAHAAFDYRAGGMGAAVMQWSGGGGVDIAFDTVSGATFEQTFALVRPYGDLVTLLQHGQTAHPPEPGIAAARGRRRAPPRRTGRRTGQDRTEHGVKPR